ncbi:hypothetical protein [Lacrimispora sp.]|uniref:hypothetical protein n=1 Tax=Lacrimispora sp. TaxID=2719234 RepID=UPI002897527D|nr:hypothetical protein [Lacrimispora sp.]
MEGRHTAEHLEKADAAIFAVDVAVKDSERFDHLPVYKTKVSAPLKDAKGIIRAALDKAETQEKREYTGSREEEKQSFGSEVKQTVLTGVSYIIPIIVAGGMINAFAV